MMAGFDTDRPITGYILGAGASVTAGYPLARDIPEALRLFATALQDNSDAARLRGWTQAVLREMESRGIQTLDELAYQHRNADGGTLVLQAKAVMSALFFSLEARSDLNAYRNFARQLVDFDDLRLGRQVEPHVPSQRFVLTYNYDRCLERALFLELSDSRRIHANLEDRLQILLNSGLDSMREVHRPIDTSRFALLKMHGTIGSLWDLPGHSDGLRSRFPIDSGAVAVNDALVAEFDHREAREASSMIAFPWETRSLHSDADRYFAEVDRAAAELLARARTLFVIGYSFPPLNEGRLVRLLTSARSLDEVLIQNPSLDSFAAAQATLAVAGIRCPVRHVAAPWRG